ncbi:hypothetical protein Avbf_01466 [Armadillidium vulgare]|nr:hypothetical protein Avbf_01466 [Armadillidium vulgare]
MYSLSLCCMDIVMSRPVTKDDSPLKDFTEPPLSRITRRKSVFAEAYNPEEEEDESERDQIGEVLDAMFERKVTEKRICNQTRR